MNYLLFGKAANTGDLGIGEAMLQDILEMDPAASFVYLCDRPDAYAELPELDGHTVGLFRDISSGSSTATVGRLSRTGEFAARLLALRWRPSLLFRREPELREIARHFEWADVMVRQGGPGWNDWVLARKVLRVRLSYYALAQHFNVPMVMYAQSYGPFEWPGGRLKRAVVRRLLDGARVLTLRDRFSRDALERLGVTKPEIVEAADVAWNLRPGSAEDARDRFREAGVAMTDRPVIGLTLRSMHGRYGVSEEEEQQLIGEFAAFCDSVIEELGTLVFLSTDYRDHGRRNDLEFLRLVQDRMRQPGELHVISDDLLPAELKAMYGEMDALVSVRLHPGIFAMASGIPTILIGYDPKCSDCSEQMGMKDRYIDVHGFNASLGISRLREMLAQRAGLAQATRQRALEIKVEARRSIQALDALRRQVAPARRA